MYIIPPFLIKLLHICEFITLFIGVLKFKKIKATYWKWFVFYLIYIFIFIYELISYYLKYTFKIKIGYYLSMVAIPVEFIFIYWLYAYKSLKKQKVILDFYISIFKFIIW